MTVLTHFHNWPCCFKIFHYSDRRAKLSFLYFFFTTLDGIYEVISNILCYTERVIQDFVFFFILLLHSLVSAKGLIPLYSSNGDIHRMLFTRSARMSKHRTTVTVPPLSWVNFDISASLLPTRMTFSPDDSSQAPHHWTGTSASSLSFSPLQFCHSCAAHVPSSDRSFFCGFLSGFPSDVQAPPCVWKKTGMSLCLCPPTRYCPSCRRFLKGPTGTGTDGSSSYCLLETKKSCTINNLELICTLWFCHIQTSIKPHF